MQRAIAFIVFLAVLCIFVVESSPLSRAVANAKSAKESLNKDYIFIRGGATAVVHVDSVSSFDQSLSSDDKLIVVDFSASWCMPCKMIAPVFEEMASEFAASATFMKVDVDEIPEIASRYQVMAMPTFLFIKNGQVVSRFSGASVEKLRETVQSLLI
jgi:thioredoxin 1